MTTIQQSAPLARASGGGASHSAGHASLQKAPVLVAGGDIQSLLFAMRMENRDQQARGQTNVITAKNQVRAEAHREAVAAEERAARAEEESGRWARFVKVASTVATVAACVAGVASVALSGGCSAPAVIALAGLLLSTSSPVIADKCGKTWGQAALYGGAAMSLAAGGYSLYSAATETAATGVVAGSHAARGAGAGVRAVGYYVEASARFTEGSARLLQGYGTVKQGDADGDIEDARATSMAAQARGKRAQNDIDQTIELLREIEASARRAASAIMSIGDTIKQTQAAVAAQIGRRA